MINGLDLFSGIGGMSIALSEWISPIAYCEIDPYCQGVLLSRMANGELAEAPIWDDIKTLSGYSFREKEIDIIYGGFPCQDISIIGSRKGLEGKRSCLAYELLRLIKEIKPKFVFVENVPNIISLGAKELTKEFYKMGMDSRWCCLSANYCGAPHKRDRWFILSHSNSESSREANSEAFTVKTFKKTWIRSSRLPRGNMSESYWKENKPPFYGMDDGFPFILDRAKALGNSVVPDQAKEAFKILMGISP